MFWHMVLPSASSVETILDKETFTLEELLDEDDVIQECKTFNGRLINFLIERAQIKQLIQYIVEEAPVDANKKRSFKFPFVACEIFTCEVDVILKALVEDEEIMDLLFSFLDPEHFHSTLLAGYFSKVVVCLFLRMTVSLMNYIQDHQDIINKLVNLIHITSTMEVLIHFIGADEHLYVNYGDSMQWVDDLNVLEMILDKFSSSDCPRVHANAAETLCTINRCAPNPGLASKISSKSFISRLYHHALDDSRPRSVLVNLLSVCVSLLDPKKSTPGEYVYNFKVLSGSFVSVNPEIVECMLENLGNLLKLLDLSSEDYFLLTTYGKLRPPLGKHRLKIVEFISVLVTVGGEAAEKELIRLGGLKRILELFFEYPYNSFLHHHVEQIVLSFLGSQNSLFVEHLLHECDLIGKILATEKNPTLAFDIGKPTVPVEGKLAPRMGNISHLTRIANKLIQLAVCNIDIQRFLQQNADWVDWQTNVLFKRNAKENIFQWECGRPTALKDQTRGTDDDYLDRDYDVAALAVNLSTAGWFETYDVNDENMHLDHESAPVFSSHESGSLLTKANWFALEDDRNLGEHSINSSNPSTKRLNEFFDEGTDDAIVEKHMNLDHMSVPKPTEAKPASNDHMQVDMKETETIGSGRQPGSVEFKEFSSPVELSSTSDFADASATTNLGPSNPYAEPLKSEIQSESPETCNTDRASADSRETGAVIESPRSAET